MPAGRSLFKPTHPEAQTVYPGLLPSYSWMQNLFNTVLDLVFPPRCAGCGRVDERWCQRCEDDLTRLPVIAQTRRIGETLVAGFTGIHEGRLQDAIHALKYEGVPELAAPLGERLVETLRILDWPVTLVIPVPLHPSRLRWRGYNQSQLIAEHLADVLALPCIPGALHRQRDTRAQVGLNREERQANMQDAFRADSALIGETTALLIDDVLTTGSTLQACAQALLESGAQAVYGLTIAAARS